MQYLDLWNFVHVYVYIVNIFTHLDLKRWTSTKIYKNLSEADSSVVNTELVNPPVSQICSAYLREGLDFHQNPTQTDSTVGVTRLQIWNYF
jgi:hypothetical protein